ncbi:MAG: hypothetical protein HYY11_02690, partial [Candidatus Methylomirabilis oxyfera]|nr:hypothetical protein [Candidatus Methylomirabilis oxyfera]
RTSSLHLSSLSKIEAEVAEAEKTLEGLAQALADPKIYQNKERLFETLDAHAQAKQKLEALMAQWDRISSLME